MTGCFCFVPYYCVDLGDYCLSGLEVLNEAGADCLDTELVSFYETGDTPETTEALAACRRPSLYLL